MRIRIWMCSCNPSKSWSRTPPVGAATHPGIDGAQFAEALRQDSPFAAGLINMNCRIAECKIRNLHVSALDQQIGAERGKLVFGKFGYDRCIAQTKAMR